MTFGRLVEGTYAYRRTAANLNHTQGECITMAVNKEELEALRIKRDDLKASKEKAELEAEIKGFSTVEVLAPTEEKMSAEMKKSAVDGDFEKFQTQMADMKHQLARVSDEKASARESGKRIFISKEVEKSFGTKGAEVVAFAKEFASHAPTFDALSQVTGRRIHNLKNFQKLFPGKGAEDVKLAIKALYSTGAGVGDEFVPTNYSDQVFERLREASAVLANLPVIDLPSNPWRIPIPGALPTTYLVTESTTDSGTAVAASDVGSAVKDFDAKKISNHVKFTDELEEDSFLAIESYIRSAMIESLNNAIERIVLFGDETVTANTNINKIDGTPVTTAGAADNWLAAHGLVYQALIASNGKKADLGSDAVAAFPGLLGLMGMGAVNPSELIAFVNVNLMFKLMGNSAVVSVDKVGGQATIIKGMLGSLYGVPLIASSGMPLANAAGKVPAAGGTLGNILIVKKNAAMIGFKRRPMIKEDEDVTKDLHTLVASARLDVQLLQANGVDRAAVAYGYNATV